MLARKLADRWLRPEVARFVAGASLIMTFGLAVLMFATARDGQTALRQNLGNDYAEFLVAGQILNDGESSRLYDLELQDELLHRLLPKLAKDEHLPFVYPPFLAEIFRPLARLPLATSFACWLVITVGLYAASVGLILRLCPLLTGSERITAWMLALAFPPFATECCLGGQISAIGCFFVTVSLYLGTTGRLLGSGLALSFVLYKPTLLVLILPMLVVGRAWRILLGWFCGAIVLAGFSLLAVGFDVCRDFVELMLGYGQSGGSVGQGFKTIKYVDLTAFFRLAGMSRSVARPLGFAVGGLIGIMLLRSWMKLAGGRISDLAWASTLALTPVLNVYGPIYDVTLVVPGVLIGSNALRRQSPTEWPLAFRWLLAIVFVGALVTQPLAQTLGFQPLTLVLLALGLFFLREIATERPDGPDVLA